MMCQLTIQSVRVIHMQHKTDDTNNDVGLRKESHHFTTVSSWDRTVNGWDKLDHRVCVIGIRTEGESVVAH